MYKLCRHVMPSGAQCNSPALRQKPCCYFHSRLRHATEPTNKVEDLEFHLPWLEDHHAIQIALTQVLSAICASQIDPRRAGLLLRGLQTASRIADRVQDRENSARTVCDEVDADSLAPEETVCEPPDDCTACEKKPTCKNPRSILYEFEERSRKKEEAARNLGKTPPAAPL